MNKLDIDTSATTLSITREDAMIVFNKKYECYMDDTDTLLYYFNWDKIQEYLEGKITLEEAVKNPIGYYEHNYEEVYYGIYGQ